MCYNNTSLLSFGDHALTIRSDEGVQQGDPLGPLFFCVSTMKLARSMMSELNLWYLDDGTIDGELPDLDLDTVRCAGATLSLLLN